MRTSLVVLIIASGLIGTAIVAGAPQSSGAAPPSNAYTTDPSLYGLPRRLASLTDLTPIHERKDLTPRQRTEVLLYWLVEERTDPSPPTRGIGGDIDSGYIQAQLIKAMAELGDILLLTQLGSDPQLDGAIRDAARIALGWIYDARQIPSLLTILERSPEPDFRALAATALGCMGATEAVPALRRALQDQFARRGGGCLEDNGLVYPVRRAAEIALRGLADPGLVAYRERRMEEFRRRLEEAQQAAPVGPAQPTPQAPAD
jgi:hypothetical protein